MKQDFHSFCLRFLRMVCKPVLPGMLAVFFSFTFTASGQLKWEHTFVSDLRASPEDGTVEIRYPFVNAGSHPVVVQKIKTSCGCTTATLAKGDYAPGEKGEILARFDIGNHVGPIEKTVTVFTDDPAQSQVQLGFRVYVWKTVSMNPAVLFWKPGTEKTTQSINIKIVRDDPLNLVRVESSSPAWQAKLQTIKPGREYVVNVTLMDPAAGASGILTVSADAPLDFPQTFRARLRVK
jgi:hypothetical protein